MGDVILNPPRQPMVPLTHDMCHAACAQYQACRLQAVSAVLAAAGAGSMLNDDLLPAGFKPASAVLAAQGTGRVLARGLDTQSLEVQSSG